MAGKEELLIALKVANAARSKSDVEGVAKAVDKMGDEAEQTGKQSKKMGADTKAAGDEGSKAGRKFKIGFASAVAGAVSLAGAIGLAKSALTEARGEAGAFAQVNATFGETTGAGFEGWATQAAKSMGLARDVAYKQSAEIGRVLGGFEIPQKKNAEFTKNLVQRSADFARFNRLDQGMVQTQFTAAMQGRTKGLAKLGIQVNKTTLAQEAMKQGLIKTEKDALTPQAKAMATYGLIMGQTRKTQGAFSKDSDSWAVKQKIVQAQYKNMKATLGTALMPVFSAFMGLMQDAIGIANKWGNALSAKVRPAIKAVSDWLLTNQERVQSWMQSGQKAFGVVLKAVDQLKNAAVALARWLADMYGEFRAGNPIVQGAALLIGAVTVGIVGQRIALAAWAAAGKAYAFVTKLMTFNTVAFNTALRANVIGIIITAVVAFAGAMYMLYKRNETFRVAVQTAWAWVKKAIGDVIAWVIPRFNAWRTAMAAVLAWVGPKVAAVFGFVKNRIMDGVAIVKWYVTAWKNVLSFIVALPAKVKAGLSGMWDGLKDAFRSALNWIIGKWNGFELSLGPIKIPGLPDVPKLSIGTPDIPMLASGGHVLGGGLAVVGERGPELVKLPGGSTVFDAQQSSAAMAGQQGSQRLVLEFGPGTTPEWRAVGRMLVKAASIESAHA